MYGQPNYYTNPYYNNQMNKYPQMQYQPQPQMQQFTQPIGIQGKTVDSIDVVKAMEIPLDGSVSYFPISDGSAIVTKQLLQDGTSKILIFKPVDNTEAQKDMPQFVTRIDLDEFLKKCDNSLLKEDIKVLKRQIKDLNEDLKELRKDDE